MGQLEYWNAVAETKTFSHPLDLPRVRALVDPSAHILDYGCGYGRLCRQLEAAGYTDVRGVDPSPRMVERARTETPRLSFDLLGGHAPFADASFDNRARYDQQVRLPPSRHASAVGRTFRMVCSSSNLAWCSAISTRRG